MAHGPRKRGRKAGLARGDQNVYIFTKGPPKIGRLGHRTLTFGVMKLVDTMQPGGALTNFSPQHRKILGQNFEKVLFASIAKPDL